MTPRTKQEFTHTVLSIAGELEVHPNFLAEVDGFFRMVKDGVPYEELLEFISDEV